MIIVHILLIYLQSYPFLLQLFIPLHHTYRIAQHKKKCTENLPQKYKKQGKTNVKQQQKHTVSARHPAPGTVSAFLHFHFPLAPREFPPKCGSHAFAQLIEPRGCSALRHSGGMFSPIGRSIPARRGFEFNILFG